MGDAAYRDLIDRLVLSCREGQGQIGPQRARTGVWNVAADSLDDGGEQARINDLLHRMTADDREVLASLLEETFAGGVHEALAVLHEVQVHPFEEGGEGTPAMDFSGRRLGLDWPTS